MDYLDWIPDRIAELRLQKGVSARDMSLSLGQSVSYINKIENGKSLPSMMGFFYICEYLGITPKEFFDTDNVNPEKEKKEPSPFLTWKTKSYCFLKIFSFISNKV